MTKNAAASLSGPWLAACMLSGMMLLPHSESGCNGHFPGRVGDGARGNWALKFTEITEISALALVQALRQCARFLAERQWDSQCQPASASECASQWDCQCHLRRFRVPFYWHVWHLPRPVSEPATGRDCACFKKKSPLSHWQWQWHLLNP